MKAWRGFLSRFLLLLFLLSAFSACSGPRPTEDTVVKRSYQLNAEQKAMIGQTMILIFSYKKNQGGDSTSERVTIQQLTYSGRTRDTIRITYREYQEGMSRFIVEDFEYEWPRYNVIDFHAGRIKVMEANDQYIRFKVLSHP